MLRSLLIGLVAGQRAMTPLALLSGAARRGDLPPGAPARDLLAHPLVALGTTALAAAEMAGDKMASAPDRTVPAGLLARSLTAGFAGAVLAPRGDRAAGAVLGIAAAIGASYLGLALRRQAMDRYGQTESGFVEDAIVLMSGAAVTHLLERDRW
ncbi:membrane protein [Aureimonas ureilytica]|uniref:Membrane protein n=1 Tax=Aureimonas ureilytica TaxID=401562 RepID=A0A175R621_9HYPH|nr:hypothetical protein [Aureimonas ureilytica]KTQ92634.1 membrane protein [Aureimonas ureilytica]